MKLCKGTIAITLVCCIFAVFCFGCTAPEESGRTSDIVDDVAETIYTQSNETRITFQTDATEQKSVNYSAVYEEIALPNWYLTYITTDGVNTLYAIASPCQNGHILDDAVTTIIAYDLTSQELTVLFEAEEETFLTGMAASVDGTVWCTIIQNMDYQALTYDLQLIALNPDGSMKEAIELPDDNQSLGHCDLATSTDGTVYYKDNTGNLMIFSSSGELLADMDAAAYGGSTMASSGDGTVYLVDDADGIALVPIDYSDGDFGEKIPIDYAFNGNVSVVSSAEEGRIYLMDRTRPYFYQLDTAEVTAMEQFQKFGIFSPYCVSFLEDASYVCLTSEMNAESVCYLRQSPDAENKKEVLTLATASQNETLTSIVRDFNRSSSDYYIQILDFSDYLLDGDYRDLFSAWNFAFAKQDFPDLIDFSSLPYMQFADKGYLLDLNDYLNSEEILPWVWNSIKYKGANYTFPCAVAVETVYGKAAALQNYDAWSVDSFCGLADTVLGQMDLLYACSSEYFLYFIERYMVSSFVDYENHTCSFDSDSFIALLNLAASMSGEKEMFIESDTTLYVRRNQALLGTEVLTSLKQMYELENIYVGEATSFIGWPGEGNLIAPVCDIGIFSACRNIDGAVAFLSYIMGEYTQETLSKYYFPITVAAFDAMCESAMRERVQSSEIATELTVDGITYPIEPLSEEQISRYCAVLQNVESRVLQDWEISKIVEDEAAAFLEGAGTAAEVALMIQNRVQIYLSEQE